MKQNLKPRNEQGQRHGYWEVYYSSNGLLDYKGDFVNGKRHGNWEEYDYNGNLKFKGNYVNGKEHGYHLEYWDNVYHKFFYKNGNRYYKNRDVNYGFETF